MSKRPPARQLSISNFYQAKSTKPSDSEIASITTEPEELILEFSDNTQNDDLPKKKLDNDSDASMYEGNLSLHLSFVYHSYYIKGNSI